MLLSRRRRQRATTAASQSGSPSPALRPVRLACRLILMLAFVGSAGVLLGRADTCSYTYRCSGSQCAEVMGGWSGTRSSSGVTMEQCESARKMAPSTSPCTCTSDSSSTSNTSGAMISNTGNFKQDMVTNATNLFIVSHTTNPVVSSFMQGAATSFISSMFANNAEAQRQQQLMAQELIRRRQEQEEQRRIAEQQRLDAMYARLNQALKLEGVPFGLSLKPMNTGEDLQLKSMNSSGPGDLKLKMGDSGGKGVPGLPGIYVGGPASPEAATNGNSADNASKGYGIQGLPGIYVGGPAGGQAGDAAGMPGLPGIYLNGVQPSQAPALAQAAQTMTGPERTLAQDTALQAAQQNAALTAPSQDSRVENFRQANQDYQQALQENGTASRDYQTAQGHVEADKSAIEIAQVKMNAVTPTPAQQEAFSQMLKAAQTDEDAAAAARKIFDNSDVHLAQARTHAAGALASLSPVSGATVPAVSATSVTSNTVDLSGARQTQPALLRRSEAAGSPVAPAPTLAAAPARVATAASHPSPLPSDGLAGCLATAAQGKRTASTPPSPEELRKQLESAQEALRRLIETHEKEDALREQWDEEVNDAVHDAKKQAFDLSVDYLLHKAQAVTRAKIWKADAEAEELRKLAEADPSKLGALQAQIEQASARAQNLQHTLQSLKDLKNGVEEQERLRDLREWAQKDPQELQQAAGYLEGVKQLVQAALAENRVKAALQFTPYVNDAIKWGSSLIDTSYDLTAEYLSSRQLDQLNRNSDQYLQAVKALNQRVQVTVTQLNCYKKDGRAVNVVADMGGSR